MVELLQADAATVAEVARAYDLHPNQLFRWRTEYERGAYGMEHKCVAREPCLLPVELIETTDATPVASPMMEMEKRAVPPALTTRVRRLRVVLPKGQMHLEDVDEEMLGMLVEALR